MNPVALSQKSQDTLGISWEDGHESQYNVRHLRLACRCAGCIDEWTRKPLIKEENIPQNVHPKKIETVGRYALNFQWSDGHNTGIYTFDHLRGLCECPKCKP